jgi:hypothetical protein
MYKRYRREMTEYARVHSLCEICVAEWLENALSKPIATRMEWSVDRATDEAFEDTFETNLSKYDCALEDMRRTMTATYQYGYHMPTNWLQIGNNKETIIGRCSDHNILSDINREGITVWGIVQNQNHSNNDRYYLCSECRNVAYHQTPTDGFIETGMCDSCHISSLKDQGRRAKKRRLKW